MYGSKHVLYPRVRVKVSGSQLKNKNGNDKKNQKTWHVE